MTGASEVFVVQLARASRRANRFVRDLPSADRKDVIAAALLWCWENRHNYSLTTTLDTWFANAVRDAYRQWQRGEARNYAETMTEIPTGDTTLAAVETQSAANALAQALPPAYKHVAKLELQGWTRAEMMKAGISHDVINNARTRIKQLRKLMPDDHEYRRALRTAPSASSEHVGEISGIDKEIEALDFPPPGGKECPPCWRCMYFLGFLPGEHRSVRMPIIEPEVAKAVADTEARKVTIANEVKRGTL